MKQPVIKEVVLVNSNDQEIGRMEKLEAHQKGLLHRAFSVFVFNSKKELLLQKRALGKYHSEGLWTNTCCSHPAPGESIELAGQKRLVEEMGFTCELTAASSFIYCVELDNDLIEHELDHVLIGISDDNPFPNADEVSEFTWMSLNDLQKEVHLYPENYTSWFRIIINEQFEQLTRSLHESLSKRNI